MTEKDCCDNPQKEFVRHLTGTGTQVRLQCSSCGKIESKAQNRKTLNVDINTLNFSDTDFDQKRKDEYVAEYRKTWEEFKAAGKQHFLNQHSNYLSSDTWKTKRALVLKRDNYICQSCLQNKATQVHHLDYQYLQNEPLFKLISVCKKCHDTITAMDNGQDYDPIH
jgi:hypothetical protein